MPKMDGIETVKKIRELGYKHPIVALTANAVLGNADLFLENGFDDFISKPIDMRQLNNILKKYIRDKQPPEVLEAVALEYAEHQENETAVKLLPPDIKIPGLDIEQGVARYDNNEAIYINILRAYTASLRTILSECENVTENDLADYKVKIHGIKGASLNIYAQPLAEIAYELEKAASAENYKFVTENNPKFFKLGKELAENLENLLSQTEKENPKPVKEKPDKEVLSELIKACELYDIDEVDKAVEKLEKYQYESDNGLMDWLKEKLALMQYAEIIERLKGET
jgi:HPt (histidine-containing phosphotransfer) domain-containing protein